MRQVPNAAPGCRRGDDTMRVWPGSPYPLGATWDGAGVNFAIFAENATKVELCLFDSPDATQEAHRIPVKEYTDKVWHAYLPDVLPGQLYGYRVHGPFEPAQGHRFNPNKVVLDPYAKLIGRNVLVGRFAVRLQVRRRAGRPLLRRPRQRPVCPAGDGDRPGLHLGRRPVAADALAQDGHLRAARQGLHPAQPQRPRAPARQLRRAGLGVGHQAPDRPGRHGRRAAAGAPLPRRPPPRREGPAQLLGLQHAGLLRPGVVLRLRGHPAGRRPAVQDDGPGDARRRAGGDPRRGLQPHRRGEPDGADALDARRGQRRLLPAGARPPLLHGLHRHGQHAEHDPAVRPPARHGQPAVLGLRDARRRLPLRPGQHPGPRAVRGQPPGRLLRHHPPGPDPLAGEADRRAVGRRAGRLPGRELPGPLDRVERQVPRLRPTVLEGGRRHRLGAGHPAGRQQRPVPGRRPQAIRQHQLHHLPRRLHPARPRQLQREAQRGQRRGQQRRRQRQQ